MKRQSWTKCGIALLLAACGLAQAAVQFKIVTASERGTYIQIGRDLARFVAPEADIELEVLPSAGSAENVQRLRYEPGVKFALVQSDVYQAFLDQAEAGNAGARELIRPLRVVMPLYNEEIYFLVRADAQFDHIHQIRDARINVGPLGSGTALSATTLYRQMFGRPPAEAQISFMSNEDALIQLITDKTIDVVVVVAGQPAKLLVDMKPEARKLIKLLALDATHPASQAAMKTYYATTVRAKSYPNLLTQDVPSLAVKAFLVTYDYQQSANLYHLGRFGRAICENFSRLQIDGHPKWFDVQLAMPNLGRGWIYSPPVARELSRCVDPAPAAPKVPAPVVKACSQQARLLGLCS